MPSLLLLFLITITIQTIVGNMEAANCGTRERLYPYFNNVDNNNNNNDNNRYYQTEWQTGSGSVDAAAVADGMNKVSNYRVSDMNDGDDEAVTLAKRRNIINKLTLGDNQNFETLLSGITGYNNNRYGNKLMKRSHYRDNSGGKNKRASFSSVYPEIMTDPGKRLNGKPEQLSSPLDDANFDLTYNSLLNQLNQLQTSGQLASLTNNANNGRVLTSSSSSTVAVDDNGTTNERTKANNNKLTFKTDGIKETADTGSETGMNYKCILNEHLILRVCVCED